MFFRSVRILLSALAFAYILPMIHGIDFHGSFVAAIGLAVFFGIAVWIVDIGAVALSAVVAVGTLGLALLWLVPLWLLAFWLLPAVALKVVAQFFPAYLTIDGWLPAILGGLVMLAIGMATSTSTKISAARPD